MLLFIAFAALLAFPAMASALTADPSGSTSLAPTVQSDKADYAPGELVTLTGGNWQPGESVHINVNDDEGQTWSRNVDVTADQSGNISDSFNLPDWFVATYKVTATGAQSGVATTSFTDGNIRVTSSPVATGTNQVLFDLTYTIHNAASGSDGNCTADAADDQPQTQQNVGSTNQNRFNQGVDAKSSVRLEAAQNADQPSGWTFKEWTGPAGSFFVIDPNNPRVVCATGNFTGLRELQAVYQGPQAPVANNDSHSVNEDGTLTVNAPGVLGNDTDANNQGNTNAGLTVKDANSTTPGVQPESQPNNGTLTLNANGSFTYTPNPNFNGTDSFTYKATDGGLNSNTATVNITVNAVNDAPDAVNDSATTAEDTAALIDVKANDTDVDGDALTITNVTNPAHGTAVVENGKVKYTPNANYNGADSFTYTVSDGKGGTDTATVNLTVTAVNDAPDAVNDSATTAEDTAALIDVKANDTDVDQGDTLTITNVTTPAHGTAVVEDGKVKYTPNANYNGSDSFTYTVSDGNGGTDTATVSITVNAVNDAPVADDQSVTTDEDTSKEVTLSGSDVDGDALTYTIVSDPQHGTLSGTGATRTYTPNNNYNGSDSFTFKANDGTTDSNTATVSITVNAVNDAPVAEDQSVSTDEDNAKNIALGASDVEGDALTYTIVDEPSHGSLSGTGATRTYTPDPNYNGPDSFTFKANDGTADSNTATVSITVTAVNDAPVAEDDSLTTDEDTAGNGNVLTNDSDVDNANLTAVLVSGPANGTLNLNNDGSYTYTPDPNYNGPDSFTYKASDGSLDSNVATVTIDVKAVNDAPVAVDDTDTTDEDTPKSIDVIANDTDVDNTNAELSVSSFTQPSNGQVSENEDGTLKYTPAEDFFGSDSFDYTVSDGKGGTDTATVNLTVTAVNDAPVAALDEETTPEDTPVAIDVLANDNEGAANEGNQTLYVKRIVDAPANGTAQVVTEDGPNKGWILYTPNANYNGADTFTYEVCDNGDPEKCTTENATVNVTISAVNDAPVAADDTATTAEDTATDINVLSNDSDVDNTNAELSVSSFTQPSNGQVSENEDGTITYTPNANYNGSDSFTYTVSDGNGGTDTATVNLTVTAVNDAPKATDDSATTAEDTPKSINVLSNDSDVDGDSLSVSAVGAANHGTATNNNDGTITYTPNANYNGSDSFTYTVSDGNGGTDTATVNLTVTAVNDAPVAAADSDTTTEDTPKSINVLSNDSDVDGDSLSVSGVGAASHGTATNNNDGTITYTPNANYNGSDSFTYTVSDGKGGTAQGMVSITVSPVNDAPTVTLTGDALADEGQTKTYTFAVSDPDSGDTFTVKSGYPDCGTGGDLVAGSLTTTASGGSFKCTFPDGLANPTVKIKVTDGGQADSNEATKSVTVANVKPTIGDLTVTGNSGIACIGSTNVVKLSFSITDPGVDTQSGTINWGDGTTTDFNGSSVTDAQHSYSAGTYTITVTAKDSDLANADPKSTTGTQNVSLLYKVSELQDPVNRTGMTMSVFKSGSTIPLKVIITDCNNQPVNGLVPRISFNRINPSTPALGVNEGLSTQPNDTNFLMRDAGNGQYIYNLSTKTLPDQDATYSANITDSKATSTAPATYAKVSQNFGIRTK